MGRSSIGAFLVAVLAFVAAVSAVGTGVVHPGSSGSALPRLGSSPKLPGPTGVESPGARADPTTATAPSHGSSLASPFEKGGSRDATGSGQGAGGGSARSSTALAPSLRGASASSPLIGTPAPMGVSDLGVGANSTYTYGTASFVGTLQLQSFAAFTPTNLTETNDPSPDWVTLQLDAVAVNVSLPPASPVRSNGTFWVQNIVHFNGTAAWLEDELWNYSAGSFGIPISTLQGTHGRIVEGQYYDGSGPVFSVPAPSPTSPLTIQLFDNITNASGHTVVSFGYVIGDRAGTYDVVSFRGTSSPTSPSQFVVNGSQSSSVGLRHDAEFVLGGDGADANANVVGLNGTATLEREETGGYAPVPSAFDAGLDASATVLGVAIAYSGTTAYLTAGPSFIYGLWNTSGPVAEKMAPSAASGWIHVQITVSPSYAFLFATNASLAAGPLRWANYSYAPTSLAGDLSTDLPPPPAGAPYNFSAWADGFSSASVTVSSTTTMPLTLALNPSPTTFDAPVYLRSTDQALAFAAAHVESTGYSPSQRTLWINASSDLLAAPFLRVNYEEYPTFSLFAALDVNLSLVVNGFVQAPNTFNYTNEAGTVIDLAHWTQGYFFYSGASASYTLENTVVEGPPTKGPSVPLIPPPSTVEFYRTPQAVATDLTVSNDAVGVTAINTSVVHLSDVEVENGAVGLLAANSSHLTLTGVTATGYDPVYEIPSTLAALVDTSLTTASDLSVTDQASGLTSQGGSGLQISGLVVASGALGLGLNATGASSLTGLSVEQGNASAGSWTNSSGLTFSSVVVNGSGLALTNDSTVSVTEGSATGIGSTVVDSFDGSSHGTFANLAASQGATAANLGQCASVKVSNITATYGSVGAYLEDVVSASGTGFASSNLSVGLLGKHLSGSLAFSGFTVTEESIGAFISDSSDVTIASVLASNATLDPGAYFTNETATQAFPAAGVGLLGDTGVTVTGVSAASYPFAVWASYSTDLSIADVSAWYGDVAVALNYTNASEVTDVFAFSEGIGLTLQNSTGTFVTDSTFEVSAGVGLQLTYGSGDVIEANNFVGNNNSSVAGTFNGSELQAWVNNTTSPTFEGNYWSDHSGSARYIINATDHAADTSPRPSFVSTFLEFDEQGLPFRSNWTVLLAQQNYTTNVSVLFVPGWDLASGRFAFSVVPIPSYPPTPSLGVVSWAGSNVTVTITFGATPGSVAYPLWLEAGAAAGGAAAAAAVAFVLLRSRHGGRPPRRRRRTD